MDTKIAFVMADGKVNNATAKLAELTDICLSPSSAYASVSGESRKDAVKAFSAILPKLGKVSHIILTDDKYETTIQFADVPAILESVVFCVTENELFRNKIEKQNELYKTRRSVKELNPTDEKRGRKAVNPADKYAVTGDLFA